MTKMHLDLPDPLYDKMRQLIERDNITIDQFIEQAVSEKVAAVHEAYLKERAQRGDRAKFERALSHIRDTEPEEWDRFPEDS
jgi:hypothetical protein